GLVLAISFAVSWYYVVIGLVVRNPEAAQSAGFILTFPLTFASSAFVSTGTMPPWLQAFADHQPVTLTADAVRALSGLDGVRQSPWPTLAWAAGLVVVLVPLSVRLFRRAS
ncbi:MAG: ABC transporter permease, partial [Phycicoccus sp.]